mmetsp:Transcript_42016/g.118804  ORF Transcript_42016/g.118804 Transcript_42016/m.118804 type:complete len:285 (+) Transcript_42016:983-1837(+)
MPGLPFGLSRHADDHRHEVRSRERNLNVAVKPEQIQAALRRPLKSLVPLSNIELHRRFQAQHCLIVKRGRPLSASRCPEHEGLVEVRACLVEDGLSIEEHFQLTLGHWIFETAIVHDEGVALEEGPADGQAHDVAPAGDRQGLDPDVLRFHEPQHAIPHGNRGSTVEGREVRVAKGRAEAPLVVAASAVAIRRPSPVDRGAAVTTGAATRGTLIQGLLGQEHQLFKCAHLNGQGPYGLLVVLGVRCRSCRQAGEQHQKQQTAPLKSRHGAEDGRTLARWFFGCT